MGRSEESLLDIALDLVAKEKQIPYEKDSYSDTCLFIVEHFQGSAWLAVCRDVGHRKH